MKSSSMICPLLFTVGAATGCFLHECGSGQECVPVPKANGVCVAESDAIQRAKVFNQAIANHMALSPEIKIAKQTSDSFKKNCYCQAATTTNNQSSQSTQQPNQTSQTTTTNNQSSQSTQQNNQTSQSTQQNNQTSQNDDDDDDDDDGTQQNNQTSQTNAPNAPTSQSASVAAFGMLASFVLLAL